jgi:hypothetical protein
MSALSSIFLKKMSMRKGLWPGRYKSTGSTSVPGFDSPWERISQNLTAFVLSVAGDVPFAGTVFEDALRGRVCVRVFVGMSVRGL